MSVSSTSASPARSKSARSARARASSSSGRTRSIGAASPMRRRIRSAMSAAPTASPFSRASIPSPTSAERCGRARSKSAARLLGAPLPGPQLAQPDEAVGRHPRAHRLQVGEGGDQLQLGGRPLAPAGEDLAVGAAADADQVAAVQALADRAHRLTPLDHPAEVAHPLADGDQYAQRPGGGDRELELLPDAQGRGLVQTPQALVDLTLDDPRRAFDRDSQRLEVGDAQPGAQSGRFTALGCRRARVGVDLERVVTLDDEQPSVLRRRGLPVEQRPPALQPPCRDRLVAAEMQGIVGQPSRHPRRAADVPGSPVNPGTLARGRRAKPRCRQATRSPSPAPPTPRRNPPARARPRSTGGPPPNPSLRGRRFRLRPGPRPSRDWESSQPRRSVRTQYWAYTPLRKRPATSPAATSSDLATSPQP